MSLCRAITFLILSALAQTAGKAAGWDVCIEVQMISLPVKEALAVVPALRRMGSFEPAATRLQAFIAEGKAEALGWLILRVPDGQKGAAESTEEVRSETEFNLSPCPVFGPLRPLPAESGPRLVVKPNVPTAFETRNIGPSCEVEPLVTDNGATIDLQLAATYIRHLPLERGLGVPAEFDGTFARQPRFATYRVRSNYSVANGAGMLVGSFIDVSDSARLILFVLRVHARPAPPTP